MRYNDFDGRLFWFGGLAKEFYFIFHPDLGSLGAETRFLLGCWTQSTLYLHDVILIIIVHVIYLSIFHELDQIGFAVSIPCLLPEQITSDSPLFFASFQ